MKTKQDAVVAWLLQIDPTRNRDEADSFALMVWEKNFKHIDFMSWNGAVTDSEFEFIVSEAKNRKAASEEDLAKLLERLGAKKRNAEA
jgi:hypothetical protein